MLGLIQTKIQLGRSGTANATSEQTINVTIDEVSDIAKCIVLVDGWATAYLTTTTNLYIQIPQRIASYSLPITQVNWQVIELGGAVGE